MAIRTATEGSFKNRFRLSNIKHSNSSRQYRHLFCFKVTSIVVKSGGHQRLIEFIDSHIDILRYYGDGQEFIAPDR